MGRRGPVKEPTKLKLIKGNPGRQKLPQNEPQPNVVSIDPEPPEWLRAYAREHWQDYAGKLARLGLLTEVDFGNFAAMCESWAAWRECDDVIRETGRTFETEKGYVGQRPEVNIGAAALQSYTRIAATFGMNPSARAGLHVENKSDPAEKLAALLSGKGSGA